MSFLYPAFLIGALAVAIPVLLHLLRRDVAPEVPFTAVRLLRRSPIDRSRRRRLRDLLLLAARVGAVLLLAAAFARPYVSGTVPATRIIAIDRSFSMGPSDRFLRALDLARAAADDAPSGVPIAVVAFDDRAEILAPAGSAADARAAIGRVQMAFGATRYEPAVARAVEAAEGTAGHLVFVTDRQRIGWEDASQLTLPPGWTVEIRNPETAPPNASVVAIRVERERVLASIRGSGNAREGDLRVLIDGRPVAAGRYRTAAGETVDVPVDVKVPRAGVLSVAIDDPAGLAADDVRFAVLGAPSAARVLVVSGTGAARQTGFYVVRAIDASEGRQESLSAALDSLGVSVSGEELAGQYAAIVLLSTRGMDRRAREAVAGYVRNGGGLLLAASSELDPTVVSSTFDWTPALDVREQAETRRLAVTDLRHPIFRPFGNLAANLGQIRFARTWRVEADGWHAVARYDDGTAALLEREEGRGRVLLFTSDLDRRWNDFPLHPAFVPFMIESVRYVAQARPGGRDFTIAEAPAGIEPRPGSYTLGAGAPTVVVNADMRESDPGALTTEEFLAMVQPAAAQPVQAAALHASRTEGRQSYWRYALILMLVVLVTESLVGRPS